MPLTTVQLLIRWHRYMPSKAFGLAGQGATLPLCQWGWSVGSHWFLVWLLLLAGAEMPISALTLLLPVQHSPCLLPHQCCHEGTLTGSLPPATVIFQSGRGFSWGKKKSTIPFQKVSQWSCELLFESDQIQRHIFPQNFQLARNSLPWLHSEIFILISNYSSQHFYRHQ